MNEVECDVVIVGAGPVGLTLALQLEQVGVHVLVLERNQEIMTEPRAVGIDGESLRTWQALDLIEDVKPYVHFMLGGRYFNADGIELFRFDYTGLEPCGYPLKQSFEQGKIDQVLADALNHRTPGSLLFGHEVLSFTEHNDSITVSCTDNGGKPLAITCSILVGCDGGRSTIRQQLNIRMVGDSNEFPWLVIDTHDPVFKSGPPVMFFCDPARPGMTLRVSEEQRRWEWMLLPGEDPETLLQEDSIAGLIAGHTDPDQVTIIRKRVYSFSAVIAEQWQCGRVLLAGDAAHMTPPFAGQGLNAGIRDTRNLYWKIALVIKGDARLDLLNSYEQERRDHTRELIDFAVKLGQQIQPLDLDLAAARDKRFLDMQKDPESLQAYLDEISSAQRIRRIESGAVVDRTGDNLSGHYIQQPAIKLSDGSTMLLDDLLGSGFTILGYDCNPASLLPYELYDKWQKLGVRYARINRATETSEGPFDTRQFLDDLFNMRAARWY